MSSLQLDLEKERRERNVSVVRRLIEEGFNRGNFVAVDETISTGMREHQRFDPPLPPGPEGTKVLIRSLRSMFPDIRLTIEDTAFEGDTVWIRMRATGTNKGSVMGKPPTGRRMEIDVFDVCRIKDGRIVEHWGVPDQLSMLEQIGIIQ
jgi:predicted SnoaL-like aldol condensation-catalyzing enzyme